MHRLSLFFVLAAVAFCSTEAAAQKRSGKIVVRASEPGAEVFVDGGRQGPAPVEIMSAVPGPHLILVKKKGFQDFQGSCEVTSGKTCAVLAKLVALVNVKVESNAIGGTLFLDGDEVGPVPFSGLVTEGVHDFAVSASGYEDKEVKVRVSRSKSVQTIRIIVRRGQASGTQGEEEACQEKKVR